jgi:hypothetical protein
MKRYKGNEFRLAVENLTYKAAQLLKVAVSKIIWGDIPTAGTTKSKRIYFCDVADDAVMNDIDVQRYVGFAVHELLHQKYTDFNVGGANHYVDTMHNAVEDAWIEHSAIKDELTGNIGNLLSAVIEQIVNKAMAEVQDWTDPAQYPFIFAVALPDICADPCWS